MYHDEQSTTSMCTYTHAQTQTYCNVDRLKIKKYQSDGKDKQQSKKKRTKTNTKKKLVSAGENTVHSCNSWETVKKKKTGGKKKKRNTTDHLSPRCLLAAPACSGQFPMIHHEPRPHTFYWILIDTATLDHTMGFRVLHVRGGW